MKRLPSVLLLFLSIASSSAAQSLSRTTVDGTTTLRRPDPGEIIIELRADPLLGRTRTASAATIDALLDRLDRDLAALSEKRVVTQSAILQHRYTRVFAGASARVDPAHIDRIRALSYVRAVHPDRYVSAFLAESVTQIGATEFWQRTGVRGAGAVVAIIDTGIDYDHPAFGGFGPGRKVKGGHDYVNDDDDPMDDAGHGTHVAGIVAANGGGLTGVAPEATLLAYKVLDAMGSGRDSAILAALEEVSRQHPDVVNMSLGRPAVPDDPVVRAIENASAAGILFCVAAGNTGRFLDIGSPGISPSAITVGAVDREGRLAPFSTRGPVVPTGDIKPEIAAPGVGIVSARNGGGTRTASGTSMAAPHVAGVAALLRSLHPTWSVATLRTAIIDGARGLDAEVMAVGGGLVYAADAAMRPVEPSVCTLPFGVTGQGSERWTATRAITLRNTTSSTQPVALTVEGLREGIDLRPSVSILELAPGSSTPVTLELEVDTTKIAMPQTGSLSFGGFLRFAGPGTSFAIPWSFVRAAKAHVTWNGSGPAAVRLGTDRMMVSGTTTAAGRSVDLFIGAGPVSLWVEGGGAANATYHILRDNLDLTSADISVGPADAPHRIELAGADAFGRLLSDRGERSTREMFIAHPHFDSNPLDSLVFLDSKQQVFFSTFTAETRVYVFERAFDSNPLGIWIGQYPILSGVDRSVTLTIEPQAWKSLVAQPVLPPDLASPYLASFASFFLRTERGTVGSLARPTGNGDSEVGTIRGWMTASESADAATTIRVEIGSDPDNAPATTDLTAEFSATAEGIVPGGFDHIGRLSTRVIPSGEPFTIGEGPAFPIATASAGDELLFASVAWEGPRGEQRICDARRTKAKLFDAAGAVIASADGAPPVSSAPGAPAPAFQMIAPLPAPGVYTLEAATNSFEVAGRASSGALRLRFDTTNTSDPLAPVLTSLRVENTSLLFSAVDLGLVGFDDLRRDKTAVHYRPHGAADDRWTAIAPVIAGEDLGDPMQPFRTPDGILYRVPLDTIAAAIHGAVDIRIHVEDASGNSTSYTIEPAMVLPTHKRRATRH